MFRSSQGTSASAKTRHGKRPELRRNRRGGRAENSGNSDQTEPGPRGRQVQKLQETRQELQPANRANRDNGHRGHYCDNFRRDNLSVVSTADEAAEVHLRQQKERADVFQSELQRFRGRARAGQFFHDPGQEELHLEETQVRQVSGN